MRMYSTKLPIPRQSRLLEHYQLSWYGSCNLLDHYTITFAFVLQRALPWILGAILAWSMYFAQRTFQHLVTIPYGGSVLLLAISVALTLLSVATVLYWDVYRRNMEISLEGLRLNFSRGIVRKNSGSIVLRSHNIVYLYQKPLDRLFGVYQLQVYGSNQPHTEYAHIPALSESDGFDLFRFITGEFSKQVSVADPDT